MNQFLNFTVLGHLATIAVGAVISFVGVLMANEGKSVRLRAVGGAIATAGFVIFMTALLTAMYAGMAAPLPEYPHD